jgi:hypothetical protein
MSQSHEQAKLKSQKLSLFHFFPVRERTSQKNVALQAHSDAGNNFQPKILVCRKENVILQAKSQK